MATHFPLLSYHVDMSNWTFQEAQDVGFTKMYGRNCHPSGTGFWSGPWTNLSMTNLMLSLKTFLFEGMAHRDFFS